MADDDTTRAPRLIEQTLALLAYAELRAILLAWAGVRTWDPAMRSRCIVARLLAEGGVGDLTARAQAALRAESQALLVPAILRAAPWPFDKIIGHGQIGSTDGLELIFHAAGRCAAAYRGNDPRLLSLAVSLADFVRSFDPRPPPPP